MVFWYLLVVSETFYDWSLERSLQHLAKNEEAKFDLAIACFILVY